MRIINEFIINADSKSEELESFALAIHNMIKLPLAIRSLNEKGIRVENGRVVDYNYTGPVLEQVLKENTMMHIVPKTGAFTGKSVVVTPIQDDKGDVVAAIGISDAYGIVDMMECLCRNVCVIQEVEECLIRKGLRTSGQPALSIV